ncbi:hypothetical protein GGI15_001158 [Coemansia interrupta]|uniref:Uncharacterized protein n=1 Tax=Coemansia interrupta TaxID=1126814 RepID=A0A9W8HKJ2_9FUNG|nr:hypothetical protein GGI15_001158 [Coemansia interrupta]
MSPDSLPRPKATLLIPDGGVLATRVHYETLNDAMFLMRVTVLSSVICLATVVLLSLATANVDIKLGVMALTSYPKLLFSSVVWSSTSVFSAIQVAWFIAYCAFSHIIRLHFNTTDPPRDWDDRNGEWSVVELDVRISPKPAPTHSSQQIQTRTRRVHFESQVSIGNRESIELAEIRADTRSLSGSYSDEADTEHSLSKLVSDQWKLCVLPSVHGAIASRQADVTLLTPDTDYLAWKSIQKRKIL